MYGYDLQPNLYPEHETEKENENDTASENTSNNDDDDDDNDDDADGDRVEVIHPSNNIVNRNNNQSNNNTNSIENIAQNVENNLDNEIQEINEINNDLNEKINNIEQDQQYDETPVKRIRKPVSNYEPSFKNKTYAQISSNEFKNNIDEVTFVQVLYKIFLSIQVNLKKGIKMFGDKAIEEMTKELRQLHMQDSFIPRLRKDISSKLWSNRCEAVNLIKEKSNGEIKDHCCADGRVQRQFISKEEAASPTAATESVLMTGVIEVKENRKVITFDIPNAFIQTYLENVNERIILTLHGIAVDMMIIIDNNYKKFVENINGKNVLYLECTNVLYGTIKATLLFYEKFRKDIESQGFVVNPYDRCVANKNINGKQMTVLYHVDDLKASHVDEKVLDEFVLFLRKIYDDEEIGKIKVNKGPNNEFMGMILEYSNKGKLVVDMKDYVKRMIDDFNYEIKKPAKSPAAEHLFKVNNKCEKLNKKMAEAFHTHVTKGLFLCKCGQPDIQTAIVF